VPEGALKLKYNDALKSKIPADALAAADKAFADVKSGAFVVPFVPEAKK
jgi:hypothetical protein